jgi:hypothetical protein
MKRVDLAGKPHNGVPTPHVNAKDLPGGVRPALPSEIPANTVYPKTPVYQYPMIPDPWL